MADQLLINEIFHSIQGESTWSGCPCVFVRLRGCHLRCSWCDTEYAFKEGQSIPCDDLLQQVLAFETPLVQVTGGEPLLQEAVLGFMTSLCNAGRTVLLETSGACDISVCDERVIRIVDMKPPGSGECERNDMDNIERLRPHDEVKFVIGDRTDYEWSRDMIISHQLPDRVRAVLLSPVFSQAKGLEIAGHAGLDPAELAAWILEDRLNARMQMQLHKSIWDPQARGV